MNILEHPNKYIESSLESSLLNILEHPNEYIGTP